MNYKNIVINWLPVILWVAFTYWMSTGAFASANTSRIIAPLLRFLNPNITDAELKMAHAVIRKTMHVTEYFVLGLLLFRSIQIQFSNLKIKRGLLYSLLILIVLAAGDEFHQGFVSSRTASLGDVGFDTLGGVLAACVILLWNRISG